MELVTHTPDFQHVGDKTCCLASKNSNTVELVKRFFGRCFFMLFIDVYCSFSCSCCRACRRRRGGGELFWNGLTHQPR